eukprot:TRINITY_DN2298_c0_g1_i8.p1 TRINITY_DN2298_c0_g1~~TRINITY_DN2298_c0_g1_i8.p1  ORF type:complete len:426 (-),score=78.01 TRINITY_DN2298_c0_g1_i8:219-1496(-)
MFQSTWTKSQTKTWKMFSLLTTLKETVQFFFLWLSVTLIKPLDVGVFVMEVAQEHRENAQKLDAIIDLFLQYVITRPTEQERDEIFEVLIRVFESLIMSTYKSKYTQFILFYMCRCKHAYVDRFLDFLCDKLTSGNASTRTMLSSSAYIGSMVGRATFIAPQTTREVLYRLVQWCHNYINKNGNEGADAQKHGLFYSICQSVLYIFCFKYEQILQLPDGMSFIQSLEFLKILQSNLNPLKLILEEVTKEFEVICDKINLPSISPILESNRSVILPTKTAWGGENQLDSFFPFDPFLLRGSSRYFVGAYQFWKSSPEDDHEELPEEEESEEAEFDEVRRSPRRRRVSDANMSTSYEDWSFGSNSNSLDLSSCPLTSFDVDGDGDGDGLGVDEGLSSAFGNSFLRVGLGLEAVKEPTKQFSQFPVSW